MGECCYFDPNQFTPWALAKKAGEQKAAITNTPMKGFTPSDPR